MCDLNNPSFAVSFACGVDTVLLGVHRTGSLVVTYVQSNINFPTTSGQWPMDRCSDKGNVLDKENVNVYTLLCTSYRRL